MKEDLRDKKQIEEMRKRLYQRGTELDKTVRHGLSDEKEEVSRDWQDAKVTQKSDRHTNDLRSGVSSIAEPPPPDEPVKAKHGYRSFVLIGSLLIFIVVALMSSLYIYKGGNQISNDNILVTVQGPTLVGGGEVMPLNIMVSNQNSVPIESATLIVKYPEGSRSVGDSAQNVYEDRIAVNNVAPGEVQNIPIKVAVYGDESIEKKIEVRIEYRVNGSSGTFYKEAEPLAFRITSSPIVLRVDNIEKVASGQLVDVTLEVDSNASTPLKDILISAEYPNGFTYESSDPEPSYGQNVWKIDELLPEENFKIKLRGLISGITDETFRINFEAGVANSNNQYLVGAVLTKTWADFLIERPFIDVDVMIGKQARDIVIPEGEFSEVEVAITNTLEESVYDMVVEVIPVGNALDKESVESKGGYYNSNDGTVRWEVSNNPSFATVLPGDVKNLSFKVSPATARSTASFDLTVNVYARRVSESSAQENLIGTRNIEAKYASQVMVGSQAGRNTSYFADTGPIPPKVGELTTYTMTLVVEAGSNDLANTVVDTSLPIYVEWLEAYDGDGELTYNSVSKKISWEVDDIKAGTKKQMNVQVGLRPSVSQIDSIPTLLNEQTVRATDLFTGTMLQGKSLAVTTRLSTEMGFDFKSGKVVP